MIFTFLKCLNNISFSFFSFLFNALLMIVHFAFINLYSVEQLQFNIVFFSETTILKSIIWSVTFISIKFNSTIKWWFISSVIQWFIVSSILFISEIVIIRVFFVLMILLMSIRFSDDLVVDYAWLQNIHQNDSVHWRID